MSDDREGYAKEAMGDGGAAFRKAAPLDANPHPPGTTEYWAWSHGWRWEQRFQELLRSTGV